MPPFSFSAAGARYCTNFKVHILKSFSLSLWERVWRGLVRDKLRTLPNLPKGGEETEHVQQKRAENFELGH